MAAGRPSMVCRRMGLLDDAIREHLELKRLRGADPGLVAREEHEAFGPMHSGDAPASEYDDTDAPGDFDEPVDEDLGWVDDDHLPAAASRSDDAQEDDRTNHGQADAVQDFSSVGQETAELDMRTVLEGEPDRGHGSVEGHAPVEAHVPAPDMRGDDALGEAPEPLYDMPGQEQLFEQRPSRDRGFDE
jgi:hypothetical protein